MTEDPSNGGCVQSWKSDTYCDDQNNTEECGWDGGDCCGDNTNTDWNQYCSDCQCLDPNGALRTDPPSPPAAAGGADQCNPQWIGDGYCDDENNTLGCGWDGGDCCGNDTDGWNQNCNECLCLDPNVSDSKK